jgi:predicted MFS family arabinose efflux permease
VSEEALTLAQEEPASVQARRVSPYAWLVLGVVFVAGVSTALSQFEAPPLLPPLMRWFRVDLASASSLVSVFAVTGAVVALPSAYVLRRLGPTTAGVVALGTVVLGGAVGAVSPNFDLLLVSRGIEGLGLGLIAVVAPTVIAAWFPPNHRGAAMGLWATWVPLGGVLMFNIAPGVAGGSDWRAVWWLGAAICLVALVLFGLLVRLPRVAPAGGPTPAPASEESLLRIAVSNRSIWVLALAFCIFNTGQAVASSFYPTFLVDQRGFSLAGASTLGSLLWLASVPSCLLGGVISDRLGSRKLVYTLPAVLMGLSWSLAFGVRGWEIPVYLVVAGLLTGAVATAVWTAAPEVMRRASATGMGMAILMFGQSLGFVIGPAIFSRLVESAGWQAAGFVWVPIGLSAAAVGWLVKVR